MREWTDLDYAQAAIDMLPGSVEEIEEFLKAQGIRSKWVNHECPITRWANKWTDHPCAAGWWELNVYSPAIDLPLPEPTREYILAVDRK